jgi:hypothetical protein
VGTHRHYSEVAAVAGDRQDPEFGKVAVKIRGIGTVPLYVVNAAVDVS